MPSPPEMAPPPGSPDEPTGRRHPAEPSRPRGPAPPGSAEEALRRLEERLDRASEAAERLMAQAAEAAGGGADRVSSSNPGEPDAGETAKPPPAGWQLPEDAPAGGPSDLDPLISLIQAMRDLIPPELQRRLVAALRELLLALRALIDWYLERLERRREQAVEVEDIPIL